MQVEEPSDLECMDVLGFIKISSHLLLMVVKTTLVRRLAVYFLKNILEGIPWPSHLLAIAEGTGGKARRRHFPHERPGRKTG